MSTHDPIPAGIRQEAAELGYENVLRSGRGYVMRSRCTQCHIPLHISISQARGRRRPTRCFFHKES